MVNFGEPQLCFSSCIVYRTPIFNVRCKIELAETLFCACVHMSAGSLLPILLVIFSTVAVESKYRLLDWELNHCLVCTYSIRCEIFLRIAAFEQMYPCLVLWRELVLHSGNNTFPLCLAVLFCPEYYDLWFLPCCTK